MNRNFERAFELNLIPSDHKTISISLTNQNPDFLKPLMISIDTFGLWEAEHPNLVLSTYYPNIPQFDHNTFHANNYLLLHQPLKIFSIAQTLFSVLLLHFKLQISNDAMQKWIEKNWRGKTKAFALWCFVIYTFPTLIHKQRMMGIKRIVVMSTACWKCL